MTEKRHILICDDEADLREMVGEYLERRGYQVTLVKDGQELDESLAKNNDFSAIFLDINMPGEDGLSILRRLRSERDICVIMLTAAGEVVDRIVGLEMGADDYLPKPVDLRELEARLKAVLRRLDASNDTTIASLPDGPKPSEMVGFNGFRFDMAGSKLFNENDEEITLTAMEFRLLKIFVENRGRVLNRDQLLEFTHDRGWDPFDRSIDIRVSRLRRKIEKDSSKPALIRTVRGIGYVFDPEK